MSEQVKHTPGPWLFGTMPGFDELHKLRGTTPEPHEGYFRANDGSWSVGHADGLICMVNFKGKAKRGRGYMVPDPEGMANARLIAAAPELLEALKAAWKHLPNSADEDGTALLVRNAIAKAEGMR